MLKKYFAYDTTYNPFKNSNDLKYITNHNTSIPNANPFIDSPFLAVPVGLVSNIDSFLSNDFVARVYDIKGTLIKELTAVQVEIGSEIFPNENEIMWFDVEGMQGTYFVNDIYKGKVLRLQGKFETTSITAEFLNNTDKNIINTIYPIGIIIELSNDKHPNTLFPNTTWVEYGLGRATVCRNIGEWEFDWTGKTGGEKYHTLNINEMPSHNHDVRKSYSKVDRGSKDVEIHEVYSRNHSWSTDNTGGNQPHNNIQPYITVRRWTRTA